MIQPTVGRVVWFFFKGQHDQPPLAAIVTYVWDDRCVNLAIFDVNGVPLQAHAPLTKIRLLQDQETPDDECFCMWMPYQRGQAQKTEALEKELAAK